MPRKFTGQCFECGGWGHKATDHQNNWVEQPEPVGESEDGQSAASEQQGRVALYSFPRGHQVSCRSLASTLDGPRAFRPTISSIRRLTHHGSQSQPPPQEQAFHWRFDGMQKGTGGGDHYGFAYNATKATLPGFTEDYKKRSGEKNPSMIFMPSEAARELENRLAHATNAAEAHAILMNMLRTANMVDLTPGRVSGRSGGSTPDQRQGQAGHGLLPGSRVAQPDRAGAGLPGNNYRVEKPGPTARGQSHQPRQMTTRNNRRGRAVVRQEEEVPDELINETGSLADGGQQNLRRRRGGKGGMTGGRGERDNYGAQASHPDAAGDPPLGNGSFRGDRRQRNRPLHWRDPEFEVGPGQVVGLNLSTSDAHALIDRFSREQPKGSRFNMELIAVSAEDYAFSGPVIKGFEK